MRVAFIGAGKVGKALGIYLERKNFEVLGFFSRSKPSTEKSSLIINGKIYSSLDILVNEAEMIIITTPDDTITEIVEQLSNVEANWNNKVVLHTSGVHSSEILSLLNQKGATILSLHPMLAFNLDPEKAAEDLKTAFFTIEGKGFKFKEIKEIFQKLDNPIIEILTKDKVIYHTAATFVSNYLVTLIDIGIKMLTDIGFSKEAAMNLIQPLVRNNINNVLQSSPEKALTGPISRGDKGTIEKHLTKLKDYNQSVLDLYRLLGLQTIDLAQRDERINDESVIEMKEVLRNHE